jgi:hypothetical protein
MEFAAEGVKRAYGLTTLMWQDLLHSPKKRASSGAKPQADRVALVVDCVGGSARTRVL